MKDDKSTYRQILKATSLFGGVQVFNILISILRSKFIAVLLGPSGMGVFGLLTSTTGFISALTNFGLGTSAVKDISSANESEDETRIGSVIKVLRKLLWFTGLLGALITIIFAPWLSQITFRNSEYSIAFIWISISVLFNQLSAGELAILQGMRKLKLLAKANLYGSALGLILVIPIYYKIGLDGIVPGIIVSSIISLLLSYFFSTRVKIKKVKVNYNQTITKGKNMLLLGFTISLSGLFTVGVSYLIRIYISNYGNIEQVGLYNAGFAIIASYTGLVLNAMATDYFPRLSAVSNNNALSMQTINEQAEIAILILAPILIIFIVLVKFIILLFYTSSFLEINDMMCWAAIGTLFRAASWSVSFAFVARGDAKLFIGVEFFANIFTLLINFLCYKLWGITGLGVAFLISYFFYLFEVIIISRKKYSFRFEYTFKKLFFIQLCLTIICYLSIKTIAQPFSYIICAILLIISSYISFREINKRVLLINIISQFFKNK